MNPKAKRARRGASIAIAAVGLIHLVLAKEQFDAQAYVGALFVAGGLASLYVAARLWMARDVVAWTLGAFVAAGMFVGFILSRTTGLPGFKEAEWETSGIISLVLEAGYLTALGLWLRHRSRRWPEESLPQTVGAAIEQVAPQPDGTAPARAAYGPRRPARPVERPTVGAGRR
jgi:hypothetical protein